MSLITQFARAVLRPAPTIAPVRPLRQLLRTRVIFDIVSFVLQARDLRRTRKVERNYIVEDDYHRDVHDYNAAVTSGKGITTTRRAEDMYHILTQPPRDVANEELLIVGPRNILELYLAWLHGFSWRNIRGIDLYSTNPKIQPMNMEDMSFEDGTFDAISMAATLAYADDTFKALSEANRVLRPGGRFVFAVTYDPADERWRGSRITGAEIREMLGRLGLEIYFYSSRDKINVAGDQQTSHRFAVRKPDPEIVPLDPLAL